MDDLNTESGQEKFIDRIAVRTTELIIKNLYKRQRDEISTVDICQEYNISRETLRRRIKSGILPTPQKKRNKNFYSRSTIELADLRGVL
jgi:response regulator of citrate/malate metabolism